MKSESKSKRLTTPVKVSGRKRLVFRCLLVFIGLVAGLILAEISIRIFDIKPQSLHGKTYLRAQADAATFYECYSSNPNGEFQPLPDTSLGEWKLTTSGLPPTELALSALKQTPWCIQDQRSDQGLRDRHYSARPPPGKIRMAMVGDSFVRGEGVAVERSLPKQLEALLGPDKYEVLNVGFVSYATEEETKMIQEISAKWKVDHFLLVFIPNDVRLTTALLDRQEYINDLINIRDEQLGEHNNKRWYYHGSRVAQLIGSVFEMRQITRETAQWYLDSYDPAINAKGLGLMAENFHTLATLPGCRVAVVLYPFLFELEQGYPLAPIHARVKKMAEEAGLPVLDLAPAFIGNKTSSLQVHPSDHHPNSRAHAIAAQAINEWLRKDLPEFLDPSAAGQAPAKTGH